MNEELEELSTYKTVSLNSEGKTFDKLENFIANDKLSLEFINNLVCVLHEVNNPEGLVIDESKPNNENVNISQGRARHSSISFLLGLCVSKFHNFLGNLSSIFNDRLIEYLDVNEPYINYKLWMITSMNHDLGYYTSYVIKDIPLSDVKVKYNLFDDSLYFGFDQLSEFSKKYPKVLKNNYERIKSYYEYSRKYHRNKKNHFEKFDHGIIGGYILYDRALSMLKPYEIDVSKDIDMSLSDMNHKLTQRDILFYKAASLTICQHNIYKSQRSEDDELYGNELKYLWTTGNYSIDRKHPLLLMLSLVDTVECVKNFSKSSDSSKSLQTLTVLENIELSVDRNNIFINYKKLDDFITKRKSDELKTIFEGCKQNIKSLSDWTEFKVEIINDNEFRIYL